VRWEAVVPFHDSGLPEVQDARRERVTSIVFGRTYRFFGADYQAEGKSADHFFIITRGWASLHMDEMDPLNIVNW
jgi:hypothetical protein